MIRHYLKTAIRSLTRNSFFTGINLIGLSIGLTCCLLMVLYIRHELSYDQFQEKGGRISRVIMEYSFAGGEKTKGNYTSAKVLPAFQQQFPEVESGVRCTMVNRIIRYEDKLFTEKRFLFADSSFFKVFSFPLLQGHPAQVFRHESGLVITESAARKYFGTDNPIGKVLLVSAKQEPFQITGIVADPPSNSQIKFDFIAPFTSLGIPEDTWWNANYTTFLLHRKESDRAALQSQIPAYMDKEMAEPGVRVRYELEPFFDVHLHSPYDGFEPAGNIQYLYMMGFVAFLLLLVACFTYINLSTARSLERAKEVGIRKVSGALKQQVFWQFSLESILICFFALLVSFGFATILLPFFNQLADRSLQASQFLDPTFLAIVFGLTLLVGFAAGSYPAVLLSGFLPVSVLKGAFKNTGSGNTLRKSLIVFQFSISVFLLMGTGVVHNQLSYIQNRNLGYSKDHVFVLPLDQKLNDKINLVKSELRQNPNIQGLSKAYESPVRINGGYGVSKSNLPSSPSWTVTANPVDDEYLKVCNIELLAGENINRTDIENAETTDSTKFRFAFILNETCARMLGWTPQQAIGQMLFLGNDRPGFVKGVVRDFHFQSMHTAIGPLMMMPGGWANTLLVKTSGGNPENTVAFLKEKWAKLAPYRPFEPRFLDDEFQELYESEKRTATVFNLFSGIAIVLACMGLFGLSAYSARQRMKEIGIRKVLGASVWQITVLLSRSFLLLVLVASLVALPIAWWMMDKWLQDFAYRTDLQIWMFAGSTLILGVLTLLTVGIQATKAAVGNPVRALRMD